MNLFFSIIKYSLLVVLLYILLEDGWYNKYSWFCTESKVYCQFRYECFFIDIVQGIFLVVLLHYFTELSWKVLLLISNLLLGFLAININISIMTETFIYFHLAYAFGTILGVLFVYRAKGAKR